ncbi:MAG: hypothetical protein KTR31_22355, partial [Myxococcales bacterium]|nr:hypothetical protein [Myxococcales bacterium]
SFNKMGDLQRALGDGAGARRSYESSLSIAEALAEREPERADYQRDLSVSYSRLGALALQEGDQASAQHYFRADFDVAERLANLEPNRVDYQCDLAISHWTMAQLEFSADHATAALRILRRLLAAEALDADQQPLIATIEAWLAAS